VSSAIAATAYITGFWTVTVNTATTAWIPANATAATLEALLEALPAIEDVTVTRSNADSTRFGFVWTVTFDAVQPLNWLTAFTAQTVNVYGEPNTATVDASWSLTPFAGSASFGLAGVGGQVPVRGVPPTYLYSDSLAAPAAPTLNSFCDSVVDGVVIGSCALGNNDVQVG
jgi:hypothetical protein